MVEIYKKNNLNPPIMDFMFERRNNTHKLKRKMALKLGLETLNNRAPQLR